jgi:threonine dehydrogenase-like Zn-dependent dehydrogenase
MKAMAIEAPGVVGLKELTQPVPGPDEVLLRVAVIGYCGSDLNTYRGLNPLVSYPRVPGHEIGATIEACGPDVPEPWRPGLAVTCAPYTSCGKCAACKKGRFNACQFNQTLGVQREGALTEFIVVPWQKLFHAPGLGVSEYAMVEPLAVGFHAVDRGRVQAGDTVLVLGAGMIGLGAIAGAGLVRGARVIAVDVDDAKLALARKAGACETVNSRTENLHERLVEWTGGHGPDVVIEAVGLAETFVAAVTEVGYAGRVVYIGYVKSPVAYETKYFLLKELDILGSRGSTAKDFEDVIALLTSGRYPMAETVTRSVPFDQAGAAMAEWSANPSAITKIQVLVP